MTIKPVSKRKPYRYQVQTKHTPFQNHLY